MVVNLLYERRPDNAVGRVSRLVGSVLDQSTAHSFTRCQYYFERKSSGYGGRAKVKPARP